MLLFEYLARLPFAKSLVHRVSEAARGKCVVYFSLHRILEDGPLAKEHPHYRTKTALLESELKHVLKHIKKTLPFVSLSESFEFLRGQKALNRSVAVLILDVPYRESIRLLKPLAVELSIPWSLALSTHSLQTGEAPWTDDILFRIVSTPKNSLTLNFLDRSFELNTLAERIAAAKHVVDILSACPPNTLWARFEQLRELLHETAYAPVSERIASIPELKKLAAHSPISYIIAGHREAPLFELAEGELKREIIGAKEELNSLFAHILLPVFYCPIPLARKQSVRLADALIQADYGASINKKPGLARPGDNMFRLPSLALGRNTHHFAHFELQDLASAIDEFLLVTLAKDKEL